MAPDGTFNIILPTVEGEHFQQLAKSAGLFLSRRLAFFSRSHLPQERWLMEFTFIRQEIAAAEELMLYDSTDGWSAEYQSLTADFYLSAKPAAGSSLS